MARRCGVVVDVSEYSDEAIESLPNVASDAAQLRELLESETIGGFDKISLVLNPGYVQSAEALSSLFADRAADDLVLLHIASHMVRDSAGSVYFLLTDSLLADPTSTAISADWLRRQIARCHSARVILLIDGWCTGGSPGLLAPGHDPKAPYAVTKVAAFPPFGRALITSEPAVTATATVEAYRSRSSGFTSTICKGLESGAADIDEDGDVTVGDLYAYLKEELLLCTPSQAPLLQTNGAESGALVVARNPNLAPVAPVVAALPRELRRLLRSTLVADKLQAIEWLSGLADGDEEALQRAAWLALHELEFDDSRRVNLAARSKIAPWSDIGNGDPLVDRTQRGIGSSGYGTVVYNISHSEVHVSHDGWDWTGGDRAGGDINKQTAGRDIAGAAAGRKNIASGSAAGVSIENAADLKHALNELISEVNIADMQVDAKIDALTALKWFEEHVEAVEAPAETTGQIGKLRAVGGWVWDKFTALMRDLPSAGLAAWLYEAAKHIVIH